MSSPIPTPPYGLGMRLIPWSGNEADPYGSYQASLPDFSLAFVQVAVKEAGKREELLDPEVQKVW